jgi:hypothetical protein
MRRLLICLAVLFVVALASQPAVEALSSCPAGRYYSCANARSLCFSYGGAFSSQFQFYCTNSNGYTERWDYFTCGGTTFQGYCYFICPSC